MISELKDIQFVVTLRGSTVERSCFARESEVENEKQKENSEKENDLRTLQLG